MRLTHRMFYCYYLLQVSCLIELTWVTALAILFNPSTTLIYLIIDEIDGHELHVLRTWV